MMKQAESSLEEYRVMLAQTCFPWCWWCGRGVEHRPQAWGSPWLIERAHIVNCPRRQDRRAVVLLCSLCHRVQHGEQLVLPGLNERMVRPYQDTMLWLKRRFDPCFYDRKFLGANTLGALARSCAPIVEVREAYRERRGEYPNYDK